MGHEIPGVIQRHDDHDESMQDIHGNQPWNLRVEKRSFRADAFIGSDILRHPQAFADCGRNFRISVGVERQAVASDGANRDSGGAARNLGSAPGLHCLLLLWRNDRTGAGVGFASGSTTESLLAFCISSASSTCVARSVAWLGPSLSGPDRRYDAADFLFVAPVLSEQVRYFAARAPQHTRAGMGTRSGSAAARGRRAYRGDAARLSAAGREPR